MTDYVETGFVDICPDLESRSPSPILQSPFSRYLDMTGVRCSTEKPNRISSFTGTPYRQPSGLRTP